LSVHTLLPPALSLLSLHDALPISCVFINDQPIRCKNLQKVTSIPRHGRLLRRGGLLALALPEEQPVQEHRQGIEHDGADEGRAEDRKSTRLNSSHVKISYAVFCLK